MQNNLESIARDLFYCKRWLILHGIYGENISIEKIKKELYKDIKRKEKGLIPKYIE